jgi:hypothetical protein
VSFHRGIDGTDPLRAQPATQEERRRALSGRLAVGTLACPLCDAPVAPPAAGLTPADALGCPFCRHEAAVRDFLSLAPPSRPARVEVRVVERHARRYEPDLT